MPIICSPLDINAAVSAIYGTGNNLHGQLGVGYCGYIPSLVTPHPLTTWAKVVYGYTHALGIKQDGSLWAWGQNGQGAMGLGVADGATYDTPIRVGTDNDWSFIACGNRSSYAIKTNGTLWSCGWNTSGQLGRNGTTDSPTLTQVGSNTTWTHVAASANGFHIIALRSDGTIWAAGANGDGQLGKGTNTSPNSTLTQVGTFGTWTSIAVGDKNTFAVRNDGTLWACGSNSYGLLGKGTSSTSASSDYSLAKVGTDTDWVRVSASEQSVVGIKTDGSIWSWGSGTNGKLGHGDTMGYFSPRRIGTDTGWKSIVATLTGSAAISSNDSLYVWGANTYGQMADGTSNVSTVYSPTMISTPTAIKSISPGYYSYIALRQDDAYSAWGYNEFSIIGDGKGQRARGFNKVPGLDGNVVSISTGSNITMVVRSDGTLWGAGLNSYSRLNDASIHNSAKFVRIGSDTDWAQVACGDLFVIARKTDGSLWSWGLNSQGQLGQGNTTNLTTPTKIGTYTWTHVSCGSAHVAAIKSDGSLWTWGANGNGQLGKGNNTSGSANYSPVRVGSATDWADIAAGDFHTIGLRGTSLYTWGRNTNGQLGKGNATDSSANYTPVLVGSGTWKRVITGVDATHCLAINTDDQLFAWGSNSSGQVSIGSTSTNITTPTRVGTFLCKDASVGQFHTAFIDMGGIAYGAGANASYQLGFDTTTLRRSPEQLSSRVWKKVFASAYGTHLIC